MHIKVNWADLKSMPVVCSYICIPLKYINLNCKTAGGN